VRNIEVSLLRLGSNKTEDQQKDKKTSAYIRSERGIELLASSFSQLMRENQGWL